MVKVVVNDDIRSALNRYNEIAADPQSNIAPIVIRTVDASICPGRTTIKDSFHDEIGQVDEHQRTKDVVSLSEIGQISSTLISRDIGGQFSIKALLKNTDLIMETRLKLDLKKIENDSNKSPEFLKSMEKLRNAELEREYEEMIKETPIPNVSKHMVNGSFNYETMSAEEDLSPAQLAKELKHQLTTIVNILVSAISVGYALWYWSSSSYMGWSQSSRTLLVIFGTILVLIAEVVVFGGYLRRIDEARQRERSKKERKQIVTTIVLDKEKNQ